MHFSSGLGTLMATARALDARMPKRRQDGSEMRMCGRHSDGGGAIRTSQARQSPPGGRGRASPSAPGLCDGLASSAEAGSALRPRSRLPIGSRTRPSPSERFQSFIEGGEVRARPGAPAAPLWRGCTAEGGRGARWPSRRRLAFLFFLKQKRWRRELAPAPPAENLRLHFCPCSGDSS